MINYSDFFLHGCSQVEIDQSVLLRTNEVVEQEMWGELVYGRVRNAVWSVNVFEDIDPPQYDLLTHHIDNSTKLLFGPQYRRFKLGLWRGTQDLDWHYDGDGETYIHWMIYFGNDQWTEEAGGFLEAQNTLVGEVKRFTPTLGTVVVLNGQGKHFVHRVTDFDPSYDRIAMLISYKREE